MTNMYPIDKNAYLVTVEEFVNECIVGCFDDDDGAGYFATEEIGH